MKHTKIWTDEEKLYINENFRYEPDTGFIYWKKSPTTFGPKRSTNKPTGVSNQLVMYDWIFVLIIVL